MIFAMDIGNTNIKTALFDGKELMHSWRMATSKTYTSDQYGILLYDLFRHAGMDMKQVEGIIVSSVVPTVNFTIDHMCRDYFGLVPMFVVPGIRTGINIRYDNPRELGSDRIANAVGTWETYGGPAIFIDFGTATTFGVLDEAGAFLGGAIFPGIKLASEALVSGTAKLPRFELTRPESVIGRNTLTNLQSGMYYGYAGVVRSLVSQMKQELGKPCQVVATGGMAAMVSDATRVIDHVDGLLTVKGLRAIYEKNV